MKLNIYCQGCRGLTSPGSNGRFRIAYELSEDMSRRRMEREAVVLAATNTLMAELAQNWSRPEGGQLLGILFQDVLHPSLNSSQPSSVTWSRAVRAHVK